LMMPNGKRQSKRGEREGAGGRKRIELATVESRGSGVECGAFPKIRPAGGFFAHSRKERAAKQPTRRSSRAKEELKLRPRAQSRSAAAVHVSLLGSLTAANMLLALSNLQRGRHPPET